MTREEAIKCLIDVKDEFAYFPNHCVAFDMAIEALNKQIGTKPYKIECKWGTQILCPQCNYRFYSLIGGEKIAGNQSLYCQCCGQRIDWMGE